MLTAVTKVYANCRCQGLMFGYATDETEESMPLTVVLSHQLNAKIAQLRRSGDLPWARPDSKTQASDSNFTSYLSLSGARCSSVVRAFAHGAMSSDRSFMGWTPLSYFSFQPVLHDCGMCYPVWDGAYKRTLAANRKE